MNKVKLEELMDYIEKALKSTFKEEDLNKPFTAEDLKGFIEKCIQELKEKCGEHTIPYLVMAFILLYSVKPSQILLILAQYTATLYVLKDVSSKS